MCCLNQQSFLIEVNYKNKNGISRHMFADKDSKIPEKMYRFRFNFIRVIFKF